MFKHLLSDNRIFGGIISVLMFIAGGLIYLQVVKSQANLDIQRTQDRLQQRNTPQTEGQTTRSKPPPPGETFETGHWHGDQWHAEPHQREKLPLVDTPDTSEKLPTPQNSGAPPLPPSSIPDDIREHLKFLPEWMTGYYYGYSKGPEPDFSMEEAKRALKILQEIIRDYNPQRPIGEIWDQYIEYEKMYRAYIKYDLGYAPLGRFGYNRTDWQYEQTWAFPEVAAIYLTDTPDDERQLFEKAKMIAMGELEPNWNEHILHDGRAFYLRYDTRYEFKWGPEGYRQTTGFSRTLDKSAPLVVIYPETTSDEELKSLGWWNFRINPYTLKPVNYELYPSYLGGR